MMCGIKLNVTTELLDGERKVSVLHRPISHDGIDANASLLFEPGWTIESGAASGSAPAHRGRPGLSRAGFAWIRNNAQEIEPKPSSSGI